MASTIQFDPETQQIIKVAQERARKLKHSALAPEHLIVAFLEQEDSVIATVFRKAGVTLIETRTALERMPNPKSSNNGPTGFSIAAQEVLATAVETMHSHGCGEVRAYHLLVGVLMRSQGLAAGLLNPFRGQFEHRARKVAEIFQSAGGLYYVDFFQTSEFEKIARMAAFLKKEQIAYAFTDAPDCRPSFHRHEESRSWLDQESFLLVSLAESEVVLAIDRSKLPQLGERLSKSL